MADEEVWIAVTTRQIVIAPTPEQWTVIDELFGSGAPFLANGEGGHVWAEVVIDDICVRMYDIAPDGMYTFEELEDWGVGWSRSKEVF